MSEHTPRWVFMEALEPVAGEAPVHVDGKVRDCVLVHIACHFTKIYVELA